MDEVFCFSCNTHLCWMTYSGPTGLHYCDSCKEALEREREEDNERENDDD